MTEQTQAIGLAAAIAKATLDVGAFTTDKRNTEQNYGYISADAVLERGGQALARVGISVIPAVVSYDVKFTPRPNKSDRIDVLVSFDMAVMLGGEVMHALWAGCGSDYSTPDKALYKAITSGHKYFLMKLLNISVGNEDSEHDNEDTQPARQPAPKNVSRPETPANAPTFVKNEVAPETNVSQNGNGNDDGAPGEAERDSKGHLFSEMNKAELAAHMTEYAKRKAADPNDKLTAAKFDNARRALAKLNGNK